MLTTLRACDNSRDLGEPGCQAICELRILAEKRLKTRQGLAQPYSGFSIVCSIVERRQSDAEIDHMRAVVDRPPDRFRRRCAAGHLNRHYRGLGRDAMNVPGGNRIAAVDLYLEGPSGIGPLPCRDHGNIGAMHRIFAEFGHTRVAILQVPRRRDLAGQIGMGEVHAVVRHRDGHALAEITALVGLVRGDMLQAPMPHVFRGLVIHAIRRGGSAQIHRPEFESHRVRRRTRRFCNPRATASSSASAAAATGRRERETGRQE